MSSTRKMPLEARKNRLDIILKEKLISHDTPKGKMYSTGNPLSLYELFLHCCNKFFRGSVESGQIYDEIKKAMPHLHHHYKKVDRTEIQSWLSGMSENDRTTFIDIIASKKVPLVTYTWSEICARDKDYSFFTSLKKISSDKIKIKYYIDSNMSQGDVHFIDLTICAPSRSTFYQQKGWYVGSICIGNLTTAEAVLASDKGDFCIRGSIEVNNKANVQEVLLLLQESCHKKLKEMMQAHQYTKEEESVIGKLDLNQIAMAVGSINEFLQIEKTSIPQLSHSSVDITEDEMIRTSLSRSQILLKN